MLPLRLSVTYAYLPAVGSSAIQQAAVCSSPICELIDFKPPALKIMKDETALAPSAGMLVAVPKSSVTNRYLFLLKVKPKKLGNAGPGACVIVGMPALPSTPTAKM